MNPEFPQESNVDVLIMGGGLAGSSMALLLKRAQPDLNILIVEKNTAFKKKVGEATSEVAGCFLTKVLGLTDYLNRNHIVKHGLRMWFNDDENTCPSRCSEIGPQNQVRLPTYQLDRSHLDEHVLELAVNEGCSLARGGNVRNIDLSENEEDHHVTFEVDGQKKEVRPHWIVDASGKAALLGRKLKSIVPLDAHPVNSQWSRFENVRSLDAVGTREKVGKKKGCNVSRTSATNHLMGRGWWCWIIPLRNGEVSAGVTYDSRYTTLEKKESIALTLKAHLMKHPVGKLMFEDAEPVKCDAHAYKNLAYSNDQTAGNRWLCVSDAAGFMDPLYSHGIDYLGHGVYFGHKVILENLASIETEYTTEEFAQQYRTSYQFWFKALYRDKYTYMGDAELMHAAYLMDLASYFIGPVRLVYGDTDTEFARLPYYGPIGERVAKFMAFYNRRLATIAEKRWKNGTYGRQNLDHHHLLTTGFEPNNKASKLLFKGIKIWLAAEISTALNRPLPSGTKTVSHSPLTSESPG